MTKWDHKSENTIVTTNEKGGGEVCVVDEPNMSIKAMYARMVANGTMATTIGHATAGDRTGDYRGITELEQATQNPKYMEFYERLDAVKRINAKIEEADKKRMKNLNKSIEKLYQIETDQKTLNVETTNNNGGKE